MASFSIPVLGSVYSVINSPEPLTGSNGVARAAIVDASQRVIWISPLIAGVDRERAIAEAVAAAWQVEAGR